jgi:hypothetical protein
MFLKDRRVSAIHNDEYGDIEMIFCSCHVRLGKGVFNPLGIMNSWSKETDFSR